jgi:hypothetical protein
MKRVTVAAFLALIASFMYFHTGSSLNYKESILAFLACFCIAGSALIISRCTYDSLVIDKIQSSLTFKRIGFFVNEVKSFKLSQISEFSIQTSITNSRIRPVKSYKLQLVLISKKTVDLFRSFDKKKIRDDVDLFDLVCYVVRLSWTSMEAS